MHNKNQELLKKLNQALSNLDAPGFTSLLQAPVKRHGRITEISQRAGLNRTSVYKLISGKRDPRFSTVLRFLNALGIKLTVEIDVDALEEQLSGISGFEPNWLELYLMEPKERIERADKVISDFNELSMIDDTSP